MTLTVSADLLRELAECRSRPRSAAIVLGPSGWKCGTWPQGPSALLTALTREDLDTCTGGEDLDDDLASALLAEEDYTVPDEDDGELRLPGDGTGWAVVTGVVDRGPDRVRGRDLSWRDARWFDRDAVRLVLDGDAVELREHGRAFSLWLTGGGNWLACMYTRYAGETDGQWLWCSPEDAAALVYDADPSLLTAGRDELPLLARAARTARDLADLCAFTTPAGGEREQQEAPRKQREEAVEHERVARIIGGLVREVLQRDVRNGRRAAAETVRTANSRNDSQTARDLGISRTSLLALINEQSR